MSEQPNPYVPPAPPAPAKKRRKWPWVLGGVFLLVVIIAVANGGGNTPSQQATGAPAGSDKSTVAAAQPATQQPTQQPAVQQPSTHTVVYKVSGKGPASSITYTTDGMTSTNQESNVKLPWTKTLTLPADQALQMVSIMAQGSGESSKIDVEIDVDGKMVKEAHADGYGIASANGNIGTLGG
ncbi:MmpS family transport accessory protein [Amycolatopsis cynarae]|uniref:MmpS family transport accessory protein n=1 Tax=Amycolatopsis cynarae TaxID=2995223 RepID=A0ABY7B8I2_9PSEU|nr:MmpS family transport accessory protein [Amycolatopsis sp. HUAS 11-8]WAL67171.1 MmpS family transport accessory protein [Amycolatopsis sp. HUAS 11-8]